jgi:hypothetical protein
MSEFIVGLVSLLEVETALKFSLMQFLFYFFASRQSFLQFLWHSLSYLLLSSHLFFWDFNDCIEVDFHSFNKGQIFLNGSICFFYSVAIDGLVFVWLELALKMFELFAIVDGNAGEPLIKITKEAICKFIFQLWVFEQQRTSKQLKGVISSRIQPSHWTVVHFSSNYCYNVHSSCSHVYDKSSLTLISSYVTIYLVKIREKCVNTHHHAVNFVALEKLLQKCISAVYGIGERFRNDERTTKATIWLHQLSKQVVIALFEQWEM